MNLQLLNPQGYIADIQSQILWGFLILALFIGTAVVGTTIFVALRYKEGNSKVKYSPDWKLNKFIVIGWWGFSLIFVMILSIIIWKTAHEVDPYKPIDSKIKPITIQVVALQWKWLFIYPDEKIATVNFIEVPVNTPINFQLTADAPMNSFWIPSLGGQIYAMTGMVTQLHLLANKEGSFPGGAAEISGAGFSSMQFIVKSTSPEEFNDWIKMVRTSKNQLNLTSYNELAKPSSNTPPTFYYYADKNLYNEIIMKFMEPSIKQNMMGM